MASRWSEDITIRFITKYLEHQCLWNIKSPQYKNKQIKQRAYADLEKTMDIPGFGEKEIKAKIKNIRYLHIVFQSVFVSVRLFVCKNFNLDHNF